MDFGKNSLTFQKNLFQYLLYLELGLCFWGICGNGSGFFCYEVESGVLLGEVLG